jgi:hypothetical protein
MIVIPSFRQKFLLALLFSCAALPLFAQEAIALADFNQVRLSYNQSGMLILGAWAVANLIWGFLGARHTAGETKAFHQMNAFWNVVNLAIAGFGYWQASQEALGLDFWATVSAQHSIEKILLLNAGLDLGYIAMGGYLMERGRRKEKGSWVGFGKSIVLQGAFLLVFDAILYGFHHSHAAELPKLLEALIP